MPSRGCCVHDTVRRTFAQSSILGYRNGMILAVLNLHVALMPPIVSAQSILQCGTCRFKYFMKMATMAAILPTESPCRH